MRVPAIEVADHGNLLAFGAHTPKSCRAPANRRDVRAQLVVNPVVSAFVEQVNIVRS